MLQRSVTRELVLFTFCPPGPLARLACSTSSAVRNPQVGSDLEPLAAHGYATSPRFACGVSCGCKQRLGLARERGDQGRAHGGRNLLLAAVARVLGAQARAHAGVDEARALVRAEREAQVLHGGDAPGLELPGIEARRAPAVASGSSPSTSTSARRSHQPVERRADLGGLGDLDEERRRELRSPGISSL